MDRTMVLTIDPTGFLSPVVLSIFFIGCVLLIKALIERDFGKVIGTTIICCGVLAIYLKTKTSVKQSQENTAPSSSSEPTSPVTDHINSGISQALLISGIIVAVLITVSIALFFVLRRARRRKKFRKAQEANWQEVLTVANKQVENWAYLSTDIENIIKYPLISDPQNSLVQEVTILAEQVRFAVKNKDVPYKDLMKPYDSWLYVNSITLENKIQQLLSKAEYDKENHLSDKEKKGLETAEQLLFTARDSQASVNERKLAYEQIQRICKQLSIHLTPRVMAGLELEASKLKELTC